MRNIWRSIEIIKEDYMLADLPEIDNSSRLDVSLKSASASSVWRQILLEGVNDI